MRSSTSSSIFLFNQSVSLFWLSGCQNKCTQVLEMPYYENREMQDPAFFLLKFYWSLIHPSDLLIPILVHNFSLQCFSALALFTRNHMLAKLMLDNQ